MFNEKNIIFQIKDSSSHNEEPTTLPEPNSPDTFEKGIEPKK